MRKADARPRGGAPPAEQPVVALEGSGHRDSCVEGFCEEGDEKHEEEERGVSLGSPDGEGNKRAHASGTAAGL